MIPTVLLLARVAIAEVLEVEEVESFPASVTSSYMLSLMQLFPMLKNNTISSDVTVRLLRLGISNNRTNFVTLHTVK